jgi:hydrogenase-4 transcriptional activator
MSKDTAGPKPGVVDLADARVRLRPRASSRASLKSELEAVRLLLDRGLTSEAKSRLSTLIAAARHDPTVLAKARCALSMALEMQGQIQESLSAVSMYETLESQQGLDEEAIAELRVRIGLAYGRAGDHPKAIALLQAADREAAEKGSSAQQGEVNLALARVYRQISEGSIARDYAKKALEHYRNTGDWRGLAESHFAIAMNDFFEGHYEAALESFEQSSKLVGEHPAPYLLGKVYNNMAGACWFLKRPHDGIRYLEKAISYYEATEHKTSATDGYNNLGINLILVGQWDRAQAALEKALTLSSQSDNRAGTPMVLDSLGELLMLRGELAEALSYLERAVSLATEDNNKWYVSQTLRTLARCHLALNEPERALKEIEGSLSLAERIGDRQALCDSRVILAEAHLLCGDSASCAADLQKVEEETGSSTHDDLAVTGEIQRIYGLLAMRQSDATLGAHHFNRCVTIFEMLGDRYRGAVGHYELGRAYIASGQPERATEHLSRAVQVFRELGAKLALARAEEALAGTDRTAPGKAEEPSTLSQLLTLRLAEASASRELLLRELAAVIDQETNARGVMIVQPDEDKRPQVVVAHGFTPEETVRYRDDLAQARTDEESEKIAARHDALIIHLRSSSAPATLFVKPRDGTVFPGGVSLQPLLRIVELGLEVCALREKARTGHGGQGETALVDQSLLPGFIHSSPAMTRLVEEVHKIRSSDVTVLITGESGTGKELVARAIHALSSRRSKVFVPFNCTAVPKELSEGYLFGYRRGAFTGAVKDSPGVIRTAAGGTLFLDEIGDLPLDVQPKILRFLQEGEIQPLGEQRPIQVDVRIIAATNTDLEDMVGNSRFREDLYYRLNVIRLRVPPLRERRSEIPAIVNYYVNHYSAKFGRRDITITPQAVDLLMVCDWPGNVRQLCNEIQRIVARAEDGAVLSPDQLSDELSRPAAPGSSSSSASITPITSIAGQNLSLADAMAELERRMITEALRKHGGNISRAARELGLTRRGLYLKLERHDMSASA